ncbi:MAG: hypothetical protein R3B09_31595 [Nannocystaceae bacterium]
MTLPFARAFAPALALPTLLLAACAGDDGETMGSSETSTMSASSTSEGATASTDATDATTDGSSSATESDAGTATTSDTTSTSTTTDDTTSTTETTGVDTSDTTSTTDDTTSTTDDTTSTTEDTTSTTGGDDQFPPIGTKDELLDWLEAGNYKTWEAESGIHPSTGPHGGQVRTFFNAALFDSFSQGLPQHPQGAVAVKELWGNGNMMIGWAVEAKVDAESMGGDGWYWYEKVGMTEYGGDKGVGLCTGCHGGGVDYVLTPWPLQ